MISDILLRAYPRFLWPGGVKPDEHIVLIFKLFFPRIFYRYSTGAACSVIGEFYIDHGGFTVFLGMLTVGFILAVPKQWMQITGSSLPAQILFVSMPAYSVSLMRGGIPAFVEYIAITLIPVFLHREVRSEGLERLREQPACEYAHAMKVRTDTGEASSTAK